MARGRSARAHGAQLVLLLRRDAPWPPAAVRIAADVNICRTGLIYSPPAPCPTIPYVREGVRAVHLGETGTRGISMSTPRSDKVPQGACRQRYEHGTVPRRGEYVIIAPFLCRVIPVQRRYILCPVGGAYTPMVIASFVFVEKGVIGQHGRSSHAQNVLGFYNNELIVIA